MEFFIIFTHTFQDYFNGTWANILIYIYAYIYVYILKDQTVINLDNVIANGDKSYRSTKTAGLTSLDGTVAKHVYEHDLYYCHGMDK